MGQGRERHFGSKIAITAVSTAPACALFDCIAGVAVMGGQVQGREFRKQRASDTITHV